MSGVSACQISEADGFYARVWTEPPSNLSRVHSLSCRSSLHVEAACGRESRSSGGKKKKKKKQPIEA